MERFVGINNEENLFNFDRTFRFCGTISHCITSYRKQSCASTTCAQLFKETENLIAQAEKQPGTHTQVGKIKSKLNQSKQQILEMELATQQKSCDVGLARLNSMKSYTEETN